MKCRPPTAFCAMKDQSINFAGCLVVNLMNFGSFLCFLVRKHFFSTPVPEIQLGFRQRTQPVLNLRLTMLCIFWPISVWLQYIYLKATVCCKTSQFYVKCSKVPWRCHLAPSGASHSAKISSDYNHWTTWIPCCWFLKLFHHALWQNSWSPNFSFETRRALGR